MMLTDRGIDLPAIRQRRSVSSSTARILVLVLF